MIRAIEVQILNHRIWKGVGPAQVGYEWIETFEDTIGAFSHIVPSEIRAPCPQVRKVVIIQCMAKGIHEILRSRGTSLFLVLIKKFIEIATYKSSNIEISMSAGNFI